MYCIVCSRTHSNLIPVYFFGFPLDNPSKLTRWIQGLCFKKGWTANHHSKICSLHFKESEVKINGNVISLDPDAIPSRETRPFPDEPQPKHPGTSYSTRTLSNRRPLAPRVTPKAPVVIPAVTLPVCSLSQLRIVSITSESAPATDELINVKEEIKSRDWDPPNDDESDGVAVITESGPFPDTAAASITFNDSVEKMRGELSRAQRALLTKQETISLLEQINRRLTDKVGRLEKIVRENSAKLYARNPLPVQPNKILMKPAGYTGGQSRSQDCRIVGTGHSDCLSSTLIDCWTRERFTNVLFVCTGSVSDSGQVRANASVLAAASPLLKKLLKDFSDLQEDAVIHLPDFSRTSVLAALQYLYTGSITVRANSFQMTEVYNLLKELEIPASAPVVIPVQNTVFLIPVGNLFHPPHQTIRIEQEPVPRAPVLDEQSGLPAESNPEPVEPAKTAEIPSEEMTLTESREDKEETLDDLPKSSKRKAEKREKPSKRKRQRPNEISLGRLRLALMEKRRLKMKYAEKTKKKEEKNQKKKISPNRDVRVSCPECGKMVKNLNSHRAVHQAHRFRCDDCGRTFVTRGQWRRHRQVQHPQDGDSGFTCEVCSKVFRIKKYLAIHVTVHTGEKRYPCRYCDRRFRTNNTRRNHQRTHTGEKPHKCHLCDRAFAQRTPLMAHIKRHEGQAERAAEKAKRAEAVKIHQCGQCPAKFRSEAYYLAHRSKHTGESPLLPCDECSEVFQRLRDLQSHQREVHASRVLLCPTCGKEFLSSGGYYYHMKKHRKPEEDNG